MLVPLETLQLIKNRSQHGHISLKILYKILEVPKIAFYGSLPIQEIITLIPQKRHMLLGHNVNMNSIRLRLFKEHFDSHGEISCVCCGMKATHFVLEGQPSVTPHLNLYGYERLFTKDHIHPKSLGGKDELSNLQVMCAECNVAKGNFIEENKC